MSYSQQLERVRDGKVRSKMLKQIIPQYKREQWNIKITRRKIFKKIQMLQASIR